MVKRKILIRSERSSAVLDALLPENAFYDILETISKQGELLIQPPVAVTPTARHHAGTVRGNQALLWWGWPRIRARPTRRRVCTDDAEARKSEVGVSFRNFQLRIV
jgi:hypothetical protein